MKTVLKIVLGIFVVLLLLVGGGLYYVYSNLDSLVERGIETAGTSAAGTRVEVAGVDLDLLAGSAVIRGFSIANPAGYSEAPMLSFDEFAVVIDIAAMSRNNGTISITSITSRNPHLLYETHGGVSNLDTVRENMGTAPAESNAEPAPEANLEIGSVIIEGIGATVISDLMPAPAEVELGDIRLENLSGTPSEIAQQIMRPMLTQIAASAARIAVTLLPEDVRAAGATLREAAGARVEQASEAVGDATQGIRAGLGNLLNRNDGEEEDVEEASDEAAANE